MNYIEHIIEPDRLLLTWQASAANKRTRKIVAYLEKVASKINLRYLTDSPEFKEAVATGFDGYPAFPLSQTFHEDVLDIFMRRLPPRTRADFSKYLASIRIKPDAKLSDFALLGYAGGKLPDDDFYVIHPFENVETECELLLNVQGFRHYPEAVSLLEDGVFVEGTEVRLIPEPENQYDNHAVAVFYKDIRVGYICRGLLTSVNSWIVENRVQSVNIERLNGTPEHRKIYIFIRIKR